MQLANNYERLERLFRVRPFIETSHRRDYGNELAWKYKRTVFMARVANQFVFALSRTWLDCYLRHVHLAYSNQIISFRYVKTPIKTMSLDAFLGAQR